MPTLSPKKLLYIMEGHQLGDLEYVLPLEKYDSHELPVFGCYLAKTTGIYVFLFDNRNTGSTARLTGFTVEVTPLIPSEGKYRQWTVKYV